MPVAAATSERRQETRYASQTASVKIHRSDPDEFVVGDLIDLSPGGAKIKLNSALRFSERIRISVAAAGLDGAIGADAVVCWVRPTKDDRWLVGCSLEDQLPPELLHDLAADGVIDRRRYARFSCKIMATARWELDKYGFPTEIRNFSVGGFCIAMASPLRGEIGATVRVEIGREPSDSSSGTLAFCGTVCWQAECDGEFLIGCTVPDKSAAELYRKLRELSAGTKK